MIQISRRTLLGATCLVPVAGCAALQTVSTPQFVNDMNAIASALSTIMPDLATVTGISSSVVAKVTGLVTTAKTLAGQVAASVGSGASTVGALASNFGSVISGITGALGVNVPGVWGTVLQAATSLLPLILSAAGVALAGPSAPAMQPTTARAILAAVAAR